MGELIPLFKTTNVQFELSAVQRLRFEALRKELRFRNVKQVASFIVYILLEYFKMKSEGWTLVMIRDGASAIVDLDLAPQRPAPGLTDRIIMRIIMAFESVVSVLQRLLRVRRPAPASEVYLLRGKEYTVRCSRELFRKIQELKDYYQGEGASVTIDRIIIQGTGLLEYYLMERRTKSVELVFEKREEGKAMTWLWEDYLSTFR